MDRAALLTEFSAFVEEFDKYQSFIDKAKSQQGKFAAAVVDKVIKDNTEKCQKVAGDILPLSGDVDAVIADLGTERDQVFKSKSTSEFQLQELELRLMIGELDDAGFAAEGKSLRDAIASVDTRVATIDAELDKFKGIMARWLTLGERSGVLAAPKPAKPGKKPKAPEPEPEAIEFSEDEEPKAERRSTTPSGEESEAIEAGDDADEPDEEPKAAKGGKKPGKAEADDLSSVLGDEEPAPEPEPAPKKARSNSIERNEIDILGDEDEDDGGAPMAPSEPASAPSASGDEFRRAVLLYQEGTAEEQIYPFNGDTMTLGRGRDNDIQVKNDSKVSRYHCKLYRRGPNFYVEDNKSANGSLVNGELITERRLFGGEEIIIGETFFRFRIMD